MHTEAGHLQKFKEGRIPNSGETGTHNLSIASQVLYHLYYQACKFVRRNPTG